MSVSFIKKNQIDPKKKIQILLKMTINYLQFISIINYYKLNWPYSLNLFLGYYAGVITSSNVISLSCIVDGYNIDLHPLYLETIFITLLPFVVFLFGVIFLTISYLITKKSPKTRLFTIFISINTLLQPSVISKLIQNLNYQQIDGKFLLVSNLDIDLLSDFHMKWVWLKSIFFLFAKFLLVIIFCCAFSHLLGNAFPIFLFRNFT